MKTRKVRSDFVNLSGMRFGRLTVIKRACGNRTKFLCHCDCGKEKVISSSSLQTQNTKSCGCLNSEITSKRNYKHGEITHHGFTKEYRTWLHLKGRCMTKTDKSYHQYGGRGITVCERWSNSFQAFLDDMGRSPEGYTLQRMHNEKGYDPSNCIWAPSYEQHLNKRQHNKWTGQTGYFHNTPISGYEEKITL